MIHRPWQRGPLEVAATHRQRRLRTLESFRATVSSSRPIATSGFFKSSRIPSMSLSLPHLSTLALNPEPLPCRCAVQLYSWSLLQASDLLSPEEATSLRDGVVYGQFHVIHTHPSWLPLQLSLSSYLSELCIYDVKSETCARGHKLQLLTLVSCSCDTSAVRSAVFEALGRLPHVSVRPIMVCQMP